MPPSSHFVVVTFAKCVYQLYTNIFTSDVSVTSSSITQWLVVTSSWPLFPVKTDFSYLHSHLALNNLTLQSSCMSLLISFFKSICQEPFQTFGNSRRFSPLDYLYLMGYLRRQFDFHWCSQKGIRCSWNFLMTENWKLIPIQK